jgi:hypothetical protein
MEQLKDYLVKRERELKDLNNLVGLLRSVKIPLKILEDGFGEVSLYGEDYFLAQNFKIWKRRHHIGGSTGSYDGGYSTDRYESYPQFYFDIKKNGLVLPVYIQHKGFEEDERVVIRSVTRTDASGDYSDMRGSNENSIDLSNVVNFFRKKGVRENLLRRLEKRIREAREL